MVTAIIVILAIFVMPILAVLTGLIRQSLKMVVLAAVTVVSLLLAVVLKLSLFDLGIRVDNISQILLPYIVFTLVGLFAIFVLTKIFKRTPQRNWHKDWHFLFLFIPISFAQEFLFRGFLMAELHVVVQSLIALIFINAVLFMFMHALYQPVKLSLPLGFVTGVAFSWIYLVFPNLILISIAHSILNFFAVMFGFFNNDYEQ